MRRDRKGRPRRAVRDGVDASPLIAFFRGPVLPIALGLFLLPPALGLLGVLAAFLG